MAGNAVMEELLRGGVPVRIAADNTTREMDDDDGSQAVDFITLGMFIIDDIEYLPPRQAITGIPGGAGTYSALGARLYSPAPRLCRTVGWIVDQGSDFPPEITTTIQSWETGALIRKDASRLTTRGWNGYISPAEPDKREFEYLTRKKRLTGADLAGTPLLQAKAFHMVCSPDRCRELVNEITSLRKEETGTYVRPLFIWEPVPDLCTPGQLLNCTNTLPLVDICSPNHAELASFIGGDGIDPVTGEIDTDAVERSCEQLLASMPSLNYTLVIRAGEKGCYMARNGGRNRRPAQKQKQRKKATYTHGGLSHDTDMMSLFAGLMQDDSGSIAREEIEVDPGIERWIPAYHTDAYKVVDPTGGGNTFLGGLAVALARGKCVEEACAWGSVAAGFAIEQTGVPELGRDEKGRETWNCVRVHDRLVEFKKRVGIA